MAGATAAGSWAVQAGALCTLSVQHCMVGFFLRQSWTTGSGNFLPQTGVILQEVLKGCVSLALAASSGEALGSIARNPREMARAGVPAFLYLLQNNLQYVALAYLEPTAYVVTYQLKILSTAVFSVFILGKQIDARRWVALVLLVVGVTTVQVATMAPRDQADGGPLHQQLLGLAAVLSSCVISGLAGVYTELILKQSKVSLWARNVQLAAWSLVIGVVGLATTGDLAKIRADGFLQGYNGWVFASVVNNGCGGLLTAVIIKYTDNIVKNFATSISIVLSAFCSVHLLGMETVWSFYGGVGAVCCATFLYGYSGTLSDLLPRQLRVGAPPVSKKRE